MSDHATESYSLANFRAAIESIRNFRPWAPERYYFWNFRNGERNERHQ